MAEEIPISEVRRVIIEYEIRVPRGAAAARPQAVPQMDEEDLARIVERAMSRNLERRGSLFNGALTS